MAYCMDQTHNRANGVLVFYEHVNDEPAMILARQVMGQGYSYIIGLSAAHQYTDDHYLMASAHKAAEVLGLGTDRSTVVHLADAILDYLGDLVRMPPPGPEPVSTDRQAAAEALRIGS